MAKQWWNRDFPEAAPSGPLTPERTAALGRKGVIEPQEEVSPDVERWVRASQFERLIPLNSPPMAVALDTEERERIVSEPIDAVGRSASLSREPGYYWFLTAYAGVLMILACFSVARGAHLRLRSDRAAANRALGPRWPGPSLGVLLPEFGSSARPIPVALPIDRGFKAVRLLPSILGLLTLITPSPALSQAWGPVGGNMTGGEKYVGGRYAPGGELNIKIGCRGPIVTYDPVQALANRRAYASAMAKARAKRTAAAKKLNEQRASGARDMVKAADTAVRMAKVFERSGNWGIAIEHYKRAVEASPESKHGKQATARLLSLGVPVPKSPPGPVASTSAQRPAPLPLSEVVLLEKKIRQTLDETKLVDTPHFVWHAKTCGLPMNEAKVTPHSKIPTEAATCGECGGGSSR